MSQVTPFVEAYKDVAPTPIVSIEEKVVLVKVEGETDGTSMNKVGISNFTQ